MEEHTDRTQGRASVSQGLQGVREAAQRDPGLRFTALLHHVTEQLQHGQFPSAEEGSCAGSRCSDVERI